ncbi:MAG: LysM domain-containing protein, partial [Clostridiaceae bacterium]|nr:LysM domain-containing protein [Clostridiaceae bacterium]
MNYDYCNGITYTIKKGDSLYEISRRHNIALGLLLRANPYVDVFNLQVGDTICIPKKEQQAMPFSNAGNGAAGMEMMPDGQSGNGTAGMEMMPGGQSGNGAAGMEMMPGGQSGNGAAG